MESKSPASSIKMNTKKNSWMMLGLVFGVSVILYILDVPIIPLSTQITSTIPTLIPTSIIITPQPTQPTTQISSAKSLSATISYFPEGMNESITVSLTITNSLVSEVSLTQSMNDGKSRRYQLAFESEIQPLVVGKDIKNLNLSRVAGASFTTDAFMQAVEKIKQQI